MTSMQSNILSFRGYILLWVLTVFAPLGLFYYSVVSPLLIVSMDSYSNMVRVYLSGMMIVGDQPGSILYSRFIPYGALMLWIAIPSFLSNIFIWRLDRGKMNIADYSWTAWLTVIALLFIQAGMMSDLIVGVIPTPITAVAQHLLFKRIYNRAKHHV